MGQFWSDLYAAGVELVLNGHEHNYQRFAPQRPDGRVDRRHGLRQFVVSTGGGRLNRVGISTRHVEVSNAATWGVLRLVLEPGRYSWQFMPAAGGSFTDAGSGTCHGRP
ncbi:MAG: hypothetical protein LC777_10280 [Actinobacteria bacterium]|nr:hypothetical protein [Actinomycetota bacterium]